MIEAVLIGVWGCGAIAWWFLMDKQDRTLAGAVVSLLWPAALVLIGIMILGDGAILRGMRR